jgi:hypothetical protein
MKLMKTLFLYSLIPFILFSSCDKVKHPYVTTSSSGGGPAAKVRKVLVEEFTGHLCANCPPGAQTILTIQNKYPDRVIAMAIHSGFYAGVSSAPYTADFHCTQGDDYFNFFGVSSNPIGMVNRRDYPNNILKNVGQWAGIVDSLMPVAPDADLKITNSYNSSTRVLNGSVICKFLNPLNGTYKIVLLVTEDSIVAAQKDGSQTPPDILNYVHRHMLRDGITTSWGDTLKTGLIAAGDSVVKTFNYTLPATFNSIAPNENYCRVVAFVYNAANYEVMQAEEKKFK